jgi:triosephosphate isomerase
MRRSLVAGNWKMHGSGATITGLLHVLIQALGEENNGAEVVVCPPAPYLPLCQQLLQGRAIAVGAQNVHAQASGAFTGDVSAAMLAEFGVRYVIAGHSERRRYAGETDSEVAQKCEAAILAGITPIVCVGESLEERDAAQAEAMVERQLLAVLDHCDVEAVGSLVVAYEPVWAIGTGKTAAPEQAQAMHAFIRRVLRDRSARLADTVRILYGGSITAENAAQLFAQQDIDGGLVGGASLKPEEFISICKSVSSQWKPW